jgi:hypothetical protein
MSWSLVAFLHSTTGCLRNLSELSLLSQQPTANSVVFGQTGRAIVGILGLLEAAE